jgi:DNA-3-methyladenine glycosylase
MHWMLNVVSEAAGYPAAVLIRAIEPQEGLAQMQRHRPVSHPVELCRGPAKLTQALRIDQALNGVDLCNRRSPLWIEPGGPLPARSIRCGPRVGLNRTPEPWKSKLWRYWVAGSVFVSR